MECLKQPLTIQIHCMHTIPDCNVLFELLLFLFFLIKVSHNKYGFNNEN